MKSPIFRRWRSPEPLVGIERIAFSPDGELIVVDGTFGRVGVSATTLKGAPAPDDDAACGFTPPDRRDLHAERDPETGRLLVVRTGGGKVLSRLRLVGGHLWEHGAAVSPDGRLAASVCDMGTSRFHGWALWVVEIERAGPLAPLPFKPGEIGVHLAFSLDGGILAAANVDGLQLLDVATVLREEELEAEAHARVRKFTRRELVETFHHGHRLQDLFTFYTRSEYAVASVKARDAEHPKAYDLHPFFRGARKPKEPVRFKLLGGRLWPDFLSGPELRFLLVSERAEEVFRRHGFTGWRSFDVEVTGRPPLRYRGLAVIGRCDPPLREDQYQDPDEYAFEKTLTDIRTWGGSDFFLMKDFPIVRITRRVLEAVREEGLTGWTASSFLEEGTIKGPRPKAMSGRASATPPPGPPLPPRVSGKPWSSALLAKALAKRGLGRLRHRILRSSRLAAVLKTRAAATEDLRLGGTRLGGEPDLPDGSRWPADRLGPLPFLGQVRLGDVEPFDREGLLPRTGLLSFFAHEPDRWKSRGPHPWSVIFTQEGRDLVRLKRPEDPDFKWRPPCAVTLRPFLSLPYYLSPEAREWRMSSEEEERYVDLTVEASRAQIRREAGHQVLGHPESIQNDASFGCGEKSRRTDPHAWRLLFQVVEDGELDTEWPDSGRMFFMARAADIETGRFEKTWLVFQGD